MRKITEETSDMYKYLMCKDGGRIFTIQNSKVIDDDCGYLFDTVEECENFWSQELTEKGLDDSKLNVLGQDGQVRIVDIFNDDIDFKTLEFLRLEKVTAEICVMNYKDLLRTDIDVYYPVFRLNA